jgi:hypothetical protein
MNRQRPDADALQARVAARLVGFLSADDAPLAAGAGERLRFARKTALERARRARDHPRPATSAAPASEVNWAAAGFGGPSGWPFGAPVPWWQRVAALLPLVVLVAGLVGIEHWSVQEQIAVAADIDAALLSDDLPPEAYADPGFAEFLLDEPVAAAPPTPSP